jgi:hypothetical protein
MNGARYWTETQPHTRIAALMREVNNEQWDRHLSQQAKYGGLWNYPPDYFDISEFIKDAMDLELMRAKHEALTDLLAPDAEPIETQVALLEFQILAAKARVEQKVGPDRPGPKIVR